MLSTGEWYKVGVVKSGIYKITYSDLQKMGFVPGEVIPANLKIYGNGGKMLPQPNDALRPVDLEENAIYVEGGDDGSFDPGDFVLFYGTSPHHFQLEVKSGEFNLERNTYSDTTYYFITHGNTAGKRLQT
ncbi:MAG: hypothetical protein OEY34_02265, partial [Cyclobacteriaceae bacterium]|nr:hypothetical protein [Cyclobacteriaceae bacterium]